MAFEVRALPITTNFTRCYTFFLILRPFPPLPPSINPQLPIWWHSQLNLLSPRQCRIIRLKNFHVRLRLRHSVGQTEYRKKPGKSGEKSERRMKWWNKKINNFLNFSAQLRRIFRRHRAICTTTSRTREYIFNKFVDCIKNWRNFSRTPERRTYLGEEEILKNMRKKRTKKSRVKK